MVWTTGSSVEEDRSSAGRSVTPLKSGGRWPLHCNLLAWYIFSTLPAPLPTETGVGMRAVKAGRGERLVDGAHPSWGTQAGSWVNLFPVLLLPFDHLRWGSFLHIRPSLGYPLTISLTPIKALPVTCISFDASGSAHEGKGVPRPFEALIKGLGSDIGETG